MHISKIQHTDLGWPYLNLYLTESEYDKLGRRCRQIDNLHDFCELNIKNETINNFVKYAFNKGLYFIRFEIVVV